MLQNIDAEKNILAGILKHNYDAYADVDDILETSSFTNIVNQLVYRCCRSAFEESTQITLDLPTILNHATKLGFDRLKNKREIEYIESLRSINIDLNNVRRFAGTVRRLEIGRLLLKQVEASTKKLENITGDEALAEILGIVENPIFDFSSQLRDDVYEPTKIGDDVGEYVENLINNPKTMPGLSTGYPIFDDVIGGGIRRKTVNVVGARMKVGKSWFAVNVALNVTQRQVPVLYLDTEMDRPDQQSRILGILSGVAVSDIEKSLFNDDLIKRDKVLDAVQVLQSVPFYYINIAGQPFEDTLSVVRRWIMKHVGFSGNRTNDCLVILDYLKLMTADNISAALQEYQKLGFMMTGLHNFAVKYDVPVFSFVQLNRDGINKESTDTIAGSDRIGWLCSNLSIFKKKELEEIEVEDGDYGNRKLINIAARHGPGMDEGEYINMSLTKNTGKLIEIGTRSAKRSNDNKQSNSGKVLQRTSD